MAKKLFFYLQLMLGCNAFAQEGNVELYEYVTDNARIFTQEHGLD